MQVDTKSKTLIAFEDKPISDFYLILFWPRYSYKYPIWKCISFLFTPTLMYTHKLTYPFMVKYRVCKLTDKASNIMEEKKLHMRQYGVVRTVENLIEQITWGGVAVNYFQSITDTQEFNSVLQHPFIL